MPEISAGEIAGIRVSEYKTDLKESKLAHETIAELVTKVRRQISEGEESKPNIFGADETALGHINFDFKEDENPQDIINKYLEFQASLPEELRQFSEQLAVERSNWCVCLREFPVSAETWSVKAKKGTQTGYFRRNEWLKVISIAEQFSAFLKQR